MKQINKNRKSKFLALCLSVMMMSSAGALFASCTDGSDSSSSSSSSSSSASSEVKDTGLIKNSGFETFNTNNGLNVIGTSVTGWSRSTNSASSGSALSSKSASGILDTSADAWDYLTGSYYESKDARDTAFESMTDAQAVALWDNFSAGDKLAFYDVWKKKNSTKKIAEDFKAYEKLNIDAEDIPDVANPGTRPNSDEDDANVLMIHNNYYTSSKKTQGTAQKFTSSSTVKVPAGSAAKVSVWVKTVNLQTTSSSGASQDAVNKGAYISLTHSVGGKSLDPLEVKNINTDTWTQYTFYLNGSFYADTTFSLVLGLGKGGGTDVYEYVNGYAFFDGIECEIITQEEYATGTAGKTELGFAADSVDKTFNAYTNDETTFALNFYNDWTPSDLLDNAVTVNETADDNGYTSNSANNPAPWLGGGFSTTVENNNTVVAQDVTGIYTKTELAANTANTYLQTVCSEFLGDENGDGTAFVGDSDKMLMLFSTNGVAYTAESAKTFTITNDYMGISFFVKTSDLGGATGAGITLVDDLTKTSFSAIDTSSMAGVSMGDVENVYDGWQQYFFFIEKDEDKASVDFKLTFNFGPTDVSSSTAKTSYAEGFAAFTKFEVFDMDQAQFDAVSTGAKVKSVTVKGPVEDEATGDSGFDSAAGVPTDALKNGLANPQNYKGVYNDSYRVGNNYDANDSEDKQNEKRKVNAYTNAGLLNKDEFANYYNSASTVAWMKGIADTTGETNAADAWTKMFGDATQPLFIWNDGADTTRSYGFIGTSKTISDEYTAVSVRVKTSANAVASVYLIDMEDDTRQSVLSIGRKLTYWYDDDGNVCTGDPSKKSTQVAFKLNKNGLYEVNKNWENYAADKHANKVYANLSAYEKDSAGNLVSAETGATHDYYDHTWNREVFYFNSADNGYYTDKAFTTRVYDLAEISELPHRFEAQANVQLMVENISTNDVWKTVTFYIHKGDLTKNYRLEVWSGTRGLGENAAVVNPANSYVIFDTNNPGSASENYPKLLAQYEDKANDADKFKGVFSYYDSDNYVRYDADMDSDKSGNTYKYTASSYEEAIAYLYYEDLNSYTVFADYSLSEKTIAATADTDDDADNSSSEEDEDDNNANVWLLASSILLALVLVLAIASICVRKIVGNKRHSKPAKKNK